MDMTTSWMWRSGEALNGLQIDTDAGRLEWFDGPGCACGDSTLSQTYADFAARGPAFADIPDDILAEVRAALAQLDAA
jgi:hypothetical protein